MKKFLIFLTAMVMGITMAMSNQITHVFAKSDIFINEVMTANTETIRDGDSEDKYTLTATAVKMPVFSHKGGFYESEFDLDISTDEPGVKIYYTRDGKEPEPGSEYTFLYKDSIEIKSRRGDPNVYSTIKAIAPGFDLRWRNPKSEVFKCSVIKAVAIREDGTKSKVVTNSYFVDQDIKTRYSIPVISIVTDPDNLFDSEKGIYVYPNFYEKGSQFERPMHIEFFEPDGTLGFSQYIGGRINGGYTREYPYRAFRLYADHGDEDKSKFSYEVFPGLTKKSNGKVMDNFKRLVLRNSGNDCQSLLFRDAVLQSLVAHLNVDTIAYRPSVVFIDGEYWGIYNIRERYDGDYIKSHYNIDKDKIAMVDLFGWTAPEVVEGGNEDVDAYNNEIINYLKENSVTNKSTYDYIKTKMDIENYINYNVAEIIFANKDWPGNNMTIWKYKTDYGKYNAQGPYGQDGRWRWMLRDTDFGYGIWGFSPSHNTLAYALGELIEKDYEFANNPEVVFLLNTLLKNEEFRNNFINTFADQLNSSFQPERVIKEIDKAKARIEKEMPEHTERWNVMGITMDTWYRDISVMKDYADRRPDYVRKHIIEKFEDYGVSGTVSIKLDSDLSKGYIKINSIDIKDSTPGVNNPDQWEGIYFKGIPVTLKAVPLKGFEFSNWEGITDGKVKEDTITFTPKEDVSIKAVYKPIQLSKYGDLNNDGEIDSTDFALLKRYILEITTQLPVEINYADLNHDSKVDSIDLAWLKRYVLNIIKEFPEKLN